MKNSKVIIIVISLLLYVTSGFGFNKDEILIRAGTNSQEVEKFILESRQKGYQNWAEFLLASMSDVDLVNLKLDEFIAYFDAIKKNYNRVNWHGKIDDNLFYHYVLPHRVSQEPLENFSTVYADTLYNLVKKTKNIREAVFRINEWVYTHVIYEPTERWDQNAVVTIKRGIGRCEELSILLIKALRTVCIPARHTYTPYWPFTNSNHAWIEVWTGDKWHYIGAAELSDLDNTWFTQNARRAAIIKSMVYGELPVNNEIVDKKESNYTIINSTPNYIDVAELVIQVKKNNLPVESSSVSINVYNYSSFSPVGLKKTDKNGYTQWIVGKTDLFVYAYKDSQIGYQIWRPSDKSNDTVIINLSKTQIPDTSFWFYTRKVNGQNPKSNYKPNTKLLNAVRDKNLAKLNVVDSTVKVSLNMLDTNLTRIISDAKANGRPLLQFYLNLPDIKRPIFIEYLKTLASKDIISIDTVDFFQELTAVQRSATLIDRTTPDSIIRDYLVCPRILYEQLGKWRLFIQTVIDEYQPMLLAPHFVVSVNDKRDSLFDWMSMYIQLKKEGDVFGSMMNPQDVYKVKRATKLEQYVFIVGALRSIGIPARVKWNEDAVEYWDGKWIEKSFDQQKEKKNFWVGIKFEANDTNVTDKMEYYDDYSITRFKESPTRLDPPIEIDNGYAIITLDNNPSYVITGWRNGFGDAYIRLKQIKASSDTFKYTINADIPEDVKPGNLIVREYKGLTGLDKFGINSKDLEKGDVLIIIYDESESSSSTIIKARDIINNFQGKLYFFDTSGVIHVISPFDIWGITNRGHGGGEKDIHIKWGVKNLPSIIYLRDGKCIFWTEGLNLHLSRLLQTFQK